VRGQGLRPGDEGRDGLSSAIGRPLLLAFWSLVLWGTLCDLVLIDAAFVEGPRAALHRVLSGGDTAAGYANLALAAVAPVVWGLVGTAAWPARRPTVAGRREDRRGGEGAGDEAR
jgi:hypothetical protein